MSSPSGSQPGFPLVRAQWHLPPNLHTSHSVQLRRHLLCVNEQPRLTLSIECRKRFHSSSETPPLHSQHTWVPQQRHQSRLCSPELITKESTALPHSRSFCQSTYFCWSTDAIPLSKRTFCHRWFSVGAPWSVFLKHALMVFRNLGYPRQDSRGKRVLLATSHLSLQDPEFQSIRPKIINAKKKKSYIKLLKTKLLGNLHDNYSGNVSFFQDTRWDWIDSHCELDG